MKKIRLKIRLLSLAILGLLSIVSFTSKAAISVGDAIAVDGIVYKVPLSENLIPNGNFNDGFTNWKEANNTQMTSTNFTVVNTFGGVFDDTYLVGKANADAAVAGSIGTAWPITKGKAYFLKYYVKYIKDTTKVDGLEAYLKISTGDTYGTETTVLVASSKVGGKNKWALNEVAFTAKNSLVQAKFRWLNGTYAFDNFYLCQLDSIGIDVAPLNTAIKDAETLATLNYSGKAALTTAIDAAKASLPGIKSVANATLASQTLALAVRTYKLTQTATKTKPVDFTFAITNPGVNSTGNNVQPEGWNISITNGNTFTATGQHYSLDATNRYMDSWNGTVGALEYLGVQEVKGLPNGRYKVTAAARASGAAGSFIFGNDKQTVIINNADVGGALTKGWNIITVDSVIVTQGTARIGAKTVKGLWTGTWFSADDFTLTYYGADSTLLVNKAELSSLKSDKGRMIPAFSPYITEYFIYLPGGTTSFNLTAVAGITGSTVANAGAVTVSGTTGERVITVTAKDGVTKKNFTIKYMIETAVLKHSYRFSDGTANDMVGKAHGVVSGTDAVIAGGVYTSNGNFITLPGDIINLSQYGAVTLEAFITTGLNSNTNYTMLAYFGAANGANSLWIQPTRSSTSGSRASTSTPYVDNKRLDDGLSHHIVSVLTIDSLYYYIDGSLVGKTAASNQISRIVNTMAYLGKGGWADPIWAGKINEFNIYNGILDAKTVAARSTGMPEDVGLYSLKADNLPMTPAFNKDVMSYSIVVPKGTKKVNLTAIPLSPDGKVLANDAVLVNGSVSVDLVNGSGSAEIYVVSSDPAVTKLKIYTVQITTNPNLVILAHSYTFEDGTAKDVINGANGIVSGTNARFINGAFVSNGDFITLPANTLALNNFGAITLEGYITAGNAVNTNYTMLSYFGGGSGANCIWIQPTRGGSNVISQTEASGVAVNGIEMDEGLTHHVVTVLTMDTIFYYIDGKEVAKKATAADKISNITRDNAWLCKGGWADPIWQGTIHEFNIYNGQLSASTIKSNANAFFENKGIALSALSVDYYTNQTPRPFNPSVKTYGVLVPPGTATMKVNAVPANVGAKVIKGGDLINVSNPAGIDTIWIESKDATVMGYYLLNYTHSTPLTLKHSYKFEDGTANDVVGNANGTLVGGTIANGMYTSTANGQYINLPADKIAINTYPAITTEMVIKAANNGNGVNVMTAYFGNTIGTSGTDYFYNSHKSRAAISCQMPAAPWAVESGVSGAKELDDAGTYHMVSTLTNDTIAWYINGELVGKAANSVANKIFNLSNKFAYLCKSGYTGDATWVGSIYEFNIWAGEMSAATISARSKALLATDIKPVSEEGNIFAIAQRGSFILQTPYTSGSVKVYNLTGKLVHMSTINANREIIPVKASGIYFIEVVNGSEKTTIKAAMK